MFCPFIKSCHICCFPSPSIRQTLVPVCRKSLAVCLLSIRQTHNIFHRKSQHNTVGIRTQPAHGSNRRHNLRLSLFRNNNHNKVLLFLHLNAEMPAHTLGIPPAAFHYGTALGSRIPCGINYVITVAAFHRNPNHCICTLLVHLFLISLRHSFLSRLYFHPGSLFVAQNL